MSGQNQAQKLSMEHINPWARIIVYVAIIGVIIKFTPILDILEFFLYFFIVPLVFLSCIGLISADTVNMIKKSIDEAKEVAREKIKEAAGNVNQQSQQQTQQSTEQSESK
jgi:hypothetical protein